MTLERHGTRDFPPGWYEKVSALARRLHEAKRARTHCRHGHAWTPENTRYVASGSRLCRACRNAARRQDAGLTPKGSNRRLGALKAWATKRARYGDAGLSPEVRQRLSQSVRDRIRRDGHHEGKKTHCKRGHPLSGPNLRRYRRRNGGWVRVCRTCTRGGRPPVVEREGVRISIRAHDDFYRREHARLRRVQIAAHPDKGGTAAKFIAASKRLDQFEAEEARWYAQWQLLAPARQAIRKVA